MNTNYGFSFGVPTQSERSGEQEGGNSNQESQDYSIDLDQITPPTFRFGQFGQAPLPSDTNDSNDNNNENCTVDDDSFLAEPSISVGQFDASFNFPKSDSTESLPKSTSTASIPTLVEEPLPQPDYLEEPAPHSVEDLFKATVDGSAAGIVLDDSWENVGIEEIEAAQAEFDAIQEAEESEGDITEMKQSEPVIEESIIEESEPVVEPEIEEPVAVAEPESVEFENSETETQKSEPVAVAEPESVESENSETETQKSEPVAVAVVATPAKETKAKVPATPKTPKAPKVTKAKAAPKVDTSVILSEGRAKRERKTVERLSEIVEPKSVKASVEKTPNIPKGTGIKLGDIEVIEKNLAKKLASDKHISTLHRIIYDRVGEARTRKSNLRAFCGLESPADSTHFEPKLQKLTVADLKALAQLLGLTGANEKAALVNKISTFLVKPDAEVVKVEKAPVKKAAVVKKKSAPAKRTASATKKSAAKKAKVLTPEIIDSDVESDVEREVLNELNNEEN